MINRQNIGKLGEKLALRYLCNKNYSCVTANFYVRGGELDLVMANSGIIVFVEVKTRSSPFFGSGEEAMNFRKTQKLLRAIHGFFEKFEEYRGANWQLDLIDIQLDRALGQAKIKHFKNILLR